MKIKMNWKIKNIILLNENGIATDIIFVQLLFWEIPLITRFNPKDHTYMNQNCFMSIDKRPAMNTHKTYESDYITSSSKRIVRRVERLLSPTQS